MFRSARAPAAWAVALLAALAVVGRDGRAAAADDPRTAPQDVARRLGELLSKSRGSERIGLCVVAVAEGAEWFAHQPDAALKPASTMKLLVTAAAFERLGGDFQFETRVYLQDGELCVLGSGDPGLGDARLAARRGQRPTDVLEDWAERLAAGGVQAVERIVLDDFVFDQQFRHEDWPAEQSARWYQAPVGGLNFNDNCLDVTVSVRGAAVTLDPVPPLPAAFIDNRLALGARNTARVHRPADSDVFELTGVVRSSCSLGPVSAARPAVFFGHALAEALARRGLAVRGGVVRRRLAPERLRGVEPLAVVRTSLVDVAWRANTFSQNLFAECLLKALAAYGPDGARSGEPGSWAGGTGVVRETLTGLGIDLSGAVLRDGSGLSHVNRLSARQLATLLARMAHRPQGDALFESLARGGQEGTLRGRFRAAAGRVRAKTGSLAGVSALAGYVDRPDGVRVAFAVLNNSGDGGEKRLEDQIVGVLLGGAGAE